jgi:hypothetical protein
VSSATVSAALLTAEDAAPAPAAEDTQGDAAELDEDEVGGHETVPASAEAAIGEFDGKTTTCI